MFIVILIISLIISSYLFKIAVGSISIFKLNMMSWIFWYEFIIGSVVASILVVYNLDHHYLIEKVVNPNVRFYGFLSVMYTIVSFPVGMLLSNIIWNKRFNNKDLFEQYLSKPISEGTLYCPVRMKFALKCVSLVSLLSVIYVLYIIGSIPLFSLFTSQSAVDILRFRVSITADFPGNEYVKNFLALMLTPILSYIAYSYFLKTHRKSDLVWTILMFVASILILTYNYEKGPVVIYLLTFLFIRVYVFGIIKKRMMLRYFLVVFICILSAYVLTSGLLNNLSFEQIRLISEAMINRVFLTQAAGTYLSFDIFPLHSEYIGFSSLSPYVSQLFDLPQSARAARIIMENVNLSGVLSGEAGVVNSLFIAEAWANWGILGVVLSPIYVGFIIQSLFIFFLKSPKSPLMLGVFSYMSCRGSITGGINDYIYNPIIVILFLLLIFLNIITSRKFSNEEYNISSTIKD